MLGFHWLRLFCWITHGTHNFHLPCSNFSFKFVPFLSQTIKLDATFMRIPSSKLPDGLQFCILAEHVGAHPLRNNIVRGKLWLIFPHIIQLQLQHTQTCKTQSTVEPSRGRPSSSVPKLSFPPLVFYSQQCIGMLFVSLLSQLHQDDQTRTTAQNRSTECSCAIEVVAAHGCSTFVTLHIINLINSSLSCHRNTDWRLLRQPSGTLLPIPKKHTWLW